MSKTWMEGKYRKQLIKEPLPLYAGAVAAYILRLNVERRDDSARCHCGGDAESM